MWKILIQVNKKLIYAIPVSMVLGFLFGLNIAPSVHNGLKSLILPLTFLMVYPMMVSLNIHHLKKGLDVKLQATTQIINFCIIPFVAFFLGKIFFPAEPYMALGLLLAALLPTSGMTISWTGFAGGNMGAAISMTVIGLTLGSLATPLYVQWLAHENVQVNFASVCFQILIIVGLPMLLGYITRQQILKKVTLKEFKERIGPKFPALSTLGVLGIVFVAMAIKSKTLLERPEDLLVIFLPLAFLYLINFIFSTILGKFFFSREDGIALVYGTVMRNLSIALAIAINSFGERGANAALVIALAYIIQVQAAAWYVKFTGSLFGEPIGERELVKQR